MKVNRLFEIVYMLMQQEGLTAKILAEHFEVSPRTIYRDIETLCEAGIPIYMQQGKGGGIALMEHFVLDKSVLLKEEQEALLGAIEILKVTPESEAMLRRISMFFGEHTRSWLHIDFSEWGNGSHTYFTEIKEAILKRQILCMTYYTGQGKKTTRKVAPLQLCFKHRNWYLRAYCYEREALRLFKLARIKQLQTTADYFESSIEDYLKEENNGTVLGHATRSIVLLIQPELAYRVYEEFQEEQLTMQMDGRFEVKLYYPEDEWLYSYLLSFGPGLEIVEPKSLQLVLKEKIEKMLGIYNKYDR